MLTSRHDSCSSCGPDGGANAPHQQDRTGDRGCGRGRHRGKRRADYIRPRTPAVPVTLADGTVSDLRQLTTARPMLLLIVSPTCGYCEQAMALRGAWRSLLPEVDVRLLLDDSPASSPWTEENEPQSLHDPDHRVTSSLADFLPTPAVVLLGVDGLLAGGPVSGTDIEPFIDDVYESLRRVRPPVLVPKRASPRPAARPR